MAYLSYHVVFSVELQLLKYNAGLTMVQMEQLHQVPHIESPHIKFFGVHCT